MAQHGLVARFWLAGPRKCNLDISHLVFGTLPQSEKLGPMAFELFSFRILFVRVSAKYARWCVYVNVIMGVLGWLECRCGGWVGLANWPGQGIFQWRFELGGHLRP